MYVRTRTLTEFSRRDGSQRIDIVQHVRTKEEFVDKNTDMVHDRALSTLVLKELDLWLSLEQSPKRTSHAGSTHVVRLYNHFLVDRRLHLVQEHCSRGDLLGVLKNEARRITAGILTSGLATSEDSLRHTMHQILLGMDFIHRNNIAHLDVSLENLFVTSRNQIKIGDFGLAMRCRRDAKGRVVKQNVAYTGKRPYAAPELYASEPLDATKADMWSIGIVLFMITTGTPLVQEATTKDATFRKLQTVGCKKILVGLPALAHCSEMLKDFLSSLLSTDPATRVSADQALRHEWLCPQQPIARVVLRPCKGDHP